MNMSKKFCAALAGFVAVVGLGAGVQAGNEVPREVTPPTQEIDASQSFTVTYGVCWYYETVVFEFEGAPSQQVPCDAEGPGNEQVDTLSGAPQGLRAAPPAELQGTATATFTGSATPGTYSGIAYVFEVLDLQGIRGPAAAAGARVDLRVDQAAPTCGNQIGCDTFSVTVRQPATTTTTTTTTTVLPTTTAVGAVPPAPTTTVVSPTLPATGPSRSDNAATIAIALVLAGGVLLFATRRGGRPSET
jgi:LPXTG-motif cell wall-anchored protein